MGRLDPSFIPPCLAVPYMTSMAISIDFSDKLALVTGASSGIGAVTARTLHAAGARIVINHPTEATTGQAEALAQELNASRAGSARVFLADVSRPEAVEEMMQKVRLAEGGLDILVNNAGILRDRTIAKMALEDWQRVIDVNLSGVFYCCKYGLEVMRDGGSIVNLSSIAAILGFFGQSNYAAAKAGVAGLSRVLSRECARRRIRVNAIAPGVIETAMAATIPQQAKDEMLKDIALGHFGQPEDIANAVLFLCSPLAAYITGQTLEVNGGWRG